MALDSSSHRDLTGLVKGRIDKRLDKGRAASRASGVEERLPLCTPLAECPVGRKAERARGRSAGRGRECGDGARARLRSRADTGDGERREDLREISAGVGSGP